MPVILLFSAVSDLLSNMYNFDLDPWLVRKRANTMKVYTIYVPLPVLHLILWYVDTFKMVENNYLPIDFIIKDWEYPAQIFLNISHGYWYG